MNLGNWTFSRIWHAIILFEMFGSNMHHNEWFQTFKIFLNSWGRALRALSPDPSGALPRFISGFALGLGFALNSQALAPWNRSLSSIIGRFAISTRASLSIHGRYAVRALDSWLRTQSPWTKLSLNFLMKNLVWPQQISGSVLNLSPPPKVHPFPSWGGLDKTLIVYIDIYFVKKQLDVIAKYICFYNRS